MHLGGKSSRLALTLGSVVLALGSRSAFASLDAARQMIASNQNLTEAIAQLSKAAKGADPKAAADYALALASSGLVSASLYEMDRAFILDGTDDEVLYAGSTLLAWLGEVQAADEIKRPPPEWVGKGPLALSSRPRKRSDLSAPFGSFGDELKKGSDLMFHSRYISAVDHFARLTAVYPKEPLGWSGYAVALENIGAYKTAARAIAMEASVTTDMDADSKSLLKEHVTDLLAQPPLTRHKANEALKGQYTAFGGASVSGGNGSSAVYSINGQFGKFVTSQLNVSANLGYSNATQFSLGVGGRWFQPLPVEAPVSATAGSSIQYASSPSSLGLILSPGLSYFINSGSLDFHVDIGVAGGTSGTVTVSLGYTYYFGRGF